LDSGAQNGDGQKERCGERKLRAKEDYILPPPVSLFVLLSGFLNVSQSKSSRRKAGQYNVTADGKTVRRKGKKKKIKSQTEGKQKRVGVKWYGESKARGMSGEGVHPPPLPILLKERR